MKDITGDDEILEVFAEEAAEVFETIDDRLPVWREYPRDKEALTDIRRGFHTLKGSGRMVNAIDLAEVAWKIENMLNRAIDGSVEVTPPMQELVVKARDVLPELLDAFKENRSADAKADVEALMVQAEALASGQPRAVTAPTSTGTLAAAGGDQSVALNLTEFNRRLERFHQRSDEALHRSEMALQHARRALAHVEAKRDEPDDRIGREEVNRIIERVNGLATEVAELGRHLERSKAERRPNPREISQLIDHRLRDRIKPLEHQLMETAQGLQRVENTGKTANTVAWVALVVGVLAGAGLAAFLLTSVFFAG